MTLCGQATLLKKGVVTKDDYQRDVLEQHQPQLLSKFDINQKYKRTMLNNFRHQNLKVSLKSYFLSSKGSNQSSFMC